VCQTYAMPMFMMSCSSFSNSNTRGVTVAGQCCVQLLWMRQTLRDIGYNLSKVPLLCDNESAICLVDNPIEHNCTKHINIRHHFLRDHQQKGYIDVCHISTDHQLADIFTKPLDEKRFCKLHSELNALYSWNLK
jgi:hypothetical protein